MKNSVFSIGINKVCLIFKKFYWIFNISYLKFLSNSEDSQLQANKTEYSVKNWKFLNSESWGWSSWHKTFVGLKTKKKQFIHNTETFYCAEG
jgi:hypothetical protein